MQGELVNGWTTHLIGWALVVFIIGLNAFLISDFVKG